MNIKYDPYLVPIVRCPWCKRVTATVCAWCESRGIPEVAT